jgi:hypothetical protein
MEALLVLIVLTVGSLLAGRYVASERRGLIGVSVVPLGIAALGIVAWVIGASSSNEEEATWSAMWLVLGVAAGIMLEALWLAGFGAGRLWRSIAQRQSRKQRGHDGWEEGSYGSLPAAGRPDRVPGLVPGAGAGSLSGEASESGW